MLTLRSRLFCFKKSKTHLLLKGIDEEKTIEKMKVMNNDESDSYEMKKRTMRVGKYKNRPADARRARRRWTRFEGFN